MLLLLKLVLVPAFVGGVTLAARRWGLRVGGLLTALPMVAGPALCFYAIEQGNGFANRLMPSSSRSHAASQGSRWDLP
jgi:hypothetical protein